MLQVLPCRLWQALEIWPQEWVYETKCRRWLERKETKNQRGWCVRRGTLIGAEVTGDDGRVEGQGGARSTAIRVSLRRGQNQCAVNTAHHQSTPQSKHSVFIECLLFSQHFTWHCEETQAHKNVLIDIQECNETQHKAVQWVVNNCSRKFIGEGNQLGWMSQGWIYGGKNMNLK